MKPKPRKKVDEKKTLSHQRGLWRGSVSFGLVNIPVYLESAQQEKKLHFRLIDKRDNAPIGYRQFNKLTGEEVSRNSIVKAYEYKKGQYVLMSEADFKKANVKATRTIDIESFVDLKEIDPMFFERPYYIIPQAGGEKGYVLLCEVLKRSNRAAIAKIVLHTVQHLVAIIPREDYLILEILRFASEVKEASDAQLLEPTVREVKVSPREISIAEQLVDGMSGDWNPRQYHDTYRDDLMRLIKIKIKRGATAAVEEVELAGEDEFATNVIDFTALLKKSLSAAKMKR